MADLFYDVVKFPNLPDHAQRGYDTWVPLARQRAAKVISEHAESTTHAQVKRWISRRLGSQGSTNLLAHNRVRLNVVAEADL